MRYGGSSPCGRCRICDVGLGGLFAGHCVPLLRKLERQAELRLQLKEFGLWRRKGRLRPLFLFVSRSPLVASEPYCAARSFQKGKIVMRQSFATLPEAERALILGPDLFHSAF